MTEPNMAQEYPTIEVRVFRDGEVIESRLVESEREAAEIVDLWAEVEGVTCVVGEPTEQNGVQMPPPVEDEYPGA